MKEQFKKLLHYFGLIITAVFFFSGLMAFFNYFKTNDSMRIQYLWNVILLCFILGTLILSTSKLDVRKTSHRSYFGNGFLFIFSGLIMLFGVGLEFSSIYGGGLSFVQGDKDVEALGFFLFNLGLLLLSVALTFLLVDSFQKFGEY